MQTNSGAGDLVSGEISAHKAMKWEPTIIELSDAICLFEEDLRYPESGMLKAFRFLLAKFPAEPAQLDEKDIAPKCHHVPIDDKTPGQWYCKLCGEPTDASAINDD